MMYLKQFPDICREMGFDVEEKAKTITLHYRHQLLHRHQQETLFGGP